MKTRFVLVMEDCVVYNKKIKKITIDWVSDIDPEEVMSISEKWITTQNFLTNRMIGLTRVGESGLTIEPLEPAVSS